MVCTKCNREIPDDAILCCYCGKKYVKAKPSKRRRSKGEGTAYKRGNTWTVRISAGSDTDDEGGYHRHRPSKGGFATKDEALAYVQTLRNGPISSSDMSLDKLYTEWEKGYEKRVGSSTMAGYKAAYNHFSKLKFRQVSTICPADLQKQITGCPNGKRTKQMMKVLAGLLWKFAVDNNVAERNIAENLYTGNDKTETREPFTDLELKKLKEAVGKEQYADYVVALCYTGFRPGELLALKKDAIHTVPKKKKEEPDKMYLVGGGKTEAGTDRIVTVPPAIVGIIKSRTEAESDFLFPNLKTGKAMSHEYFRKFCFDPLMEKLGIKGKVPYSCRHTYSNLIKSAPGDTGDKARLMGHTDYTFTQERYQSSAFDDLLKITDSLK